jgi:hypothetical protein
VPEKGRDLLYKSAPFPERPSFERPNRFSPNCDARIRTVPSIHRAPLRFQTAKLIQIANANDKTSPFIGFFVTARQFVCIQVIGVLNAFQHGSLKSSGSRLG